MYGFTKTHDAHIIVHGHRQVKGGPQRGCNVGTSPARHGGSGVADASGSRIDDPGGTDSHTCWHISVGIGIGDDAGRGVDNLADNNPGAICGAGRTGSAPMHCGGCRGINETGSDFCAANVYGNGAGLIHGTGHGFSSGRPDQQCCGW